VSLPRTWPPASRIRAKVPGSADARYTTSRVRRGGWQCAHEVAMCFVVVTEEVNVSRLAVAQEDTGERRPAAQVKRRTTRARARAETRVRNPGRCDGRSAPSRMAPRGPLSRHAEQPTPHLATSTEVREDPLPISPDGVRTREEPHVTAVGLAK
jgi:hypothetical protein